MFLFFSSKQFRVGVLLLTVETLFPVQLNFVLSKKNSSLGTFLKTGYAKLVVDTCGEGNSDVIEFSPYVTQVDIERDDGSSPFNDSAVIIESEFDLMFAKLQDVFSVKSFVLKATDKPVKLDIVFKDDKSRFSSDSVAQRDFSFAKGFGLSKDWCRHFDSSCFETSCLEFFSNK